MEMQLLTLGEPNARLCDVLTYALDGIPMRRVRLEDIRPGPVLFAAHIDEAGTNPALHALVQKLRAMRDGLRGCVGGILIDGAGELYTKALARDLAFAANASGCAFVGRPLVEATGSLYNFRTLAHVYGADLMGAYKEAARDLAKRLFAHRANACAQTRLLTLYASAREKSNTYALYKMVQAKLPPEVACKEIMLRNGEVADCEGCQYTACLHFSEKAACFYGGVMVDEVYPALLNCDALMLLCPNYNDAADANITAFINRTTALLRTTRFYDKSLFAIIVSGYSGGDIVASQLIGALNMNKSFHLPPRFCMLETANDPGSIYRVPGITKKAEDFASAIAAHLCVYTSL